MQEKRRKYSPEFKAEAARLVIESSRPIVEVARELGIHEGTLARGSINTGLSMPAMNHR
jgi:transposase-like protein